MQITNTTTRFTGADLRLLRRQWYDDRDDLQLDLTFEEYLAEVSDEYLARLRAANAKGIAASRPLVDEVRRGEHVAVYDDYDGAPDANSPIGRGSSREEALRLLLFVIALTFLSVYGYAMGALSCVVGTCTQ